MTDSLTAVTMNMTRVCFLVPENWKIPKMSQRLSGGTDYEAWAEEAESVLVTNGLWKYIDPKNPSSIPPKDADNKADWEEKNLTLIHTLRLMMDRKIAHLIKGCTTASQAWKMLVKTLSTQGPMHQVSLIKKALNIRFNVSTDIETTLHELEHTLDRMFDGGEITSDNWKVMICLNSLQNEPFHHIRDQLEGLLTSTTAGLDYNGVSARLRYEAQKVQYANEQLTTEQANTAVNKKGTAGNANMVICVNCNKVGHTKEKCWRPGGGDEGGASEEVVNKCNVDWSKYNNEQINSALYDAPRFLDSGATIHCTPYKGDFENLTPITLRSIKGINGSNIMAIGSGDVKIHAKNGLTFTLHDVLYVPQATIRLISVGKLVRANLTCTFDQSGCHVFDETKREVISSVITDTGLFHTTLHLQKEYANVVRAPADLQTWHRRLGHINYSSIINMVKHHMATGMPTDLSTIPPVCEHCILGKQAKQPIPK